MIARMHARAVMFYHTIHKPDPSKIRLKDQKRERSTRQLTPYRKEKTLAKSLAKSFSKSFAKSPLIANFAEK